MTRGDNQLLTLLKRARRPKPAAEANATQVETTASVDQSQQVDVPTVIPIRSFEVLPTLLRFHFSLESNAGEVGTKGLSDIELLQDEDQGADRARNLVASAVRAILSQKSPTQTYLESLITLGQVTNDLSSVAQHAIAYNANKYSLDKAGQDEQTLRENATKLPGQFQDMIHSLSDVIDSGDFTREQSIGMLDGVVPHDTSKTSRGIEDLLESMMQLEESIFDVSKGLSGVSGLSDLKAKSEGARATRDSQVDGTKFQQSLRPISIKSFLALLDMVRYQTRNAPAHLDTQTEWEAIRTLTQPDEARQLIVDALFGMMSHSADTQEPPNESIMRLSNFQKRLKELTHELDPRNKSRGGSETWDLTSRRFSLRDDYESAVRSLSRAVDGGDRLTRSMITAMLDEHTMLIPPCNTDDDVTDIKGLLEGVMQLEETIITLATGLIKHHPGARSEALAE